MKIDFCPHQPQGSGVCSFVTWENRDLQEALRRCFNESPREEIVLIEVTREGLKAYFNTRNAARG